MTTPYINRKIFEKPINPSIILLFWTLYTQDANCMLGREDPL